MLVGLATQPPIQTSVREWLNTLQNQGSQD